MSATDTDAIVLESVRDGQKVFGVVDAGEDNDYPDGSDPRYPARAGITRGGGITDRVFALLDGLGATSDNVEFFIGTHPHSDHIGGADELIERYRPKRVYLMPYNDGCISTPSRLWDNLYVYDKAVAAAESCGAVLVQSFDPSAPVSPGVTTDVDGSVLVDPSPQVGNPKFTLGAMDIEVVNYDQDYLTQPKWDANEFSLGVIVSVNGHRVFLAGDIDNVDGDEGRLAGQIGKVDVMKVAHHGWAKSNTPAFMEALNPDMCVMTAPMRTITPSDDLLGWLSRRNPRAQFMDTGTAQRAGLASVDIDLSGPAVSNNWPANADATYVRDESPHCVSIVGGYLKPLTGWHADPAGNRRYFDNSCFAAENRWVSADGGSYWVGADGLVTSNGAAKVDDGSMHLFDGNGKLVEGSGWKLYAGRYYLLDSGSRVLTGWQKVGGENYYLDPQTGVMATGWTKVGNDWFWMRPSGARGSGWLNDRGTWYFLDRSSGVMRTGWANVDGARYFFAEDSGAMATGWRDLGGKRYLFSDSGAMQAGWAKSGGRWYYLAADGSMQTGWLKNGGQWYWLDPQTGAMATGWAMADGSWYWLRPSASAWGPEGSMGTGWLQDGGRWYYLSGSGAMTTGWQFVGGSWYWLRPSASAWGPEGSMGTGWLDDGGRWYYLAGSGAMQVGWQKVGGTWYYLDPNAGGAMVTGTVVIGGRQERFSSSGAWLG
ncbi:MBL fold metallo-hydrolase [Atopobiaceae bacterium 24-176]